MISLLIYAFHVNNCIMYINNSHIMIISLTEKCGAFQKCVFKQLYNYFLEHNIVFYIIIQYDKAVLTKSSGKSCPRSSYVRVLQA